LLTLYEIRELVKLLEQTDVESVEVKTGKSLLSIKRRITAPAETAFAQASGVPQQGMSSREETAAAIAPLPVKPAANPVREEKGIKPVQAKPEAKSASSSHLMTENLHKIVSPMVGTFYRAPAEGAPPYVQVHDRVEESTVVCIVEAMKLFNEIEAEVRGEIVEVLVENGQLVEPGQALFLVKKEE